MSSSVVGEHYQCALPGQRHRPMGVGVTEPSSGLAAWSLCCGECRSRETQSQLTHHPTLGASHQVPVSDEEAARVARQRGGKGQSEEERRARGTPDGLAAQNSKPMMRPDLPAIRRLEKSGAVCGKQLRVGVVPAEIHRDAHKDIIALEQHLSGNPSGNAAGEPVSGAIPKQFFLLRP